MSYSHAGRSFPTRELARWAVMLSSLELRWRYTPDGLADFLLEDRRIALKVVKNIEAFPSFATVRQIGWPTALVPASVALATNDVMVTNFDGDQRPGHICTGAQWACAKHAAKTAFAKPQPPAWLKRVAATYC